MDVGRDNFMGGRLASKRCMLEIIGKLGSPDQGSEVSLHYCTIFSIFVWFAACPLQNKV